MHPFIQNLAEKENMTLEERAIVGLSRVVCERVRLGNKSHVEDMTRQIAKWLMELNPLHLNGPKLSEWATSIAEEQISDFRGLSKGRNAYSEQGNNGELDDQVRHRGPRTSR